MAPSNSSPSSTTAPVDAQPPITPAEVSLPEITPKAVILSVVLAAVLAGANAYLGLFAGMTVSASIPAAVASMAILRLCRESNILENNIVQTAASSGEALAAGVIFTIPALLLIGHWTVFEYWQTASIALVGGILGVLCTIPLRRALIVEARLRFPEGVATAEVLKVGSPTAGPPAAAPSGTPEARAGFRTLLMAGVVGGSVKFCESGLRVWSEALEGAGQVGRTILYGGVNLSAALLGVGFIIGLNTALVVFAGGVVGWLVLLPAYGAIVGVPHGLAPLDAARAVWGAQIRYVGIGAMLVGGLWTLFGLRRPVLESVRYLHAAYRLTTARALPNHGGSLARTDRDASLPWIAIPFLMSLVPMAVIYRGVVDDVFVAVIMTVAMALAAFLFSSVAAYMAGLVGSSSNPVSGVTIATLMLAAGLLVMLLGHGNPAGPAATLLIGAVVCCAAAMGGDNLQDLKTGHLVGATPWKQQIMQVIGVVSGAIVIVPVLTLLQAKYGIGEPTITHPHPLSAPQATLMASLARGVFRGGLPWGLVGLGMGIGLIVILLDRHLEGRGSTFRLPVLAVALGIYLPLKLSAAILFGGLLAAGAGRGSAGGAPTQQGLLFAAGLVTGEALMGILLAVPVGLGALWPAISSDPFAQFEKPPLGPWPGVLVLAAVAVLLYRSAVASAGSRR